MPDERSARSPLMLTVTALFLVVAFVLLGRWQMSRVYRPVDGYSAEPAAVPFATLVPSGSAAPAAAISRQVSLTGHFFATGQVVVPGHTLSGQPVSWVVTPLVTADGTEVLVVRGWVGANDGALAAPPAGVVAVTARVESGAVLPIATATAAGASTRVWSGFVIRTAQAPPDPLSLQPVPAAPPHIAAPAEFHLQNAIYVVQWFLLAVIAVVTWWRFLRASREWDTTDEKRALEPAA
jgi:cytochrome oxidase assembly protein ShyY1